MIRATELRKKITARPRLEMDYIYMVRMEG